MKSGNFKFWGAVGLVVFLLAVISAITVRHLMQPVHVAEITISVGEPHPLRYQEMPRIFNFDMKTLTAELFLQDVAGRLTGSERVTLLGTHSSERVADDRLVVAALKKARSLRAKNGWLTLTCRHADKELAERLVVLNVDVWDDYLKRLGAEKIQSRVKELEQRLAEEKRRLEEFRGLLTGGGASDEIERMEHLTTVTLPERVSALEKGSPYDEVGYILRAPNRSSHYRLEVTLIDYLLIGGGVLGVGSGALVFVILVGVAAWQLTTRKNRDQRGVVSGGGGV